MGHSLPLCLQKVPTLPRYLNFKYHHPLAHTLAVALRLQDRANGHCTFASDCMDEREDDFSNSKLSG